jgi:hypothetical protein
VEFAQVGTGHVVKYFEDVRNRLGLLFNFSGKIQASWGHALNRVPEHGVNTLKRSVPDEDLDALSHRLPEIKTVKHYLRGRTSSC